MAKATMVSNDFVSAREIGEPGRYIYNFIGNHDDEIPAEGETDGSSFLAIDTKKLYFFRATSGQWEPLGGGDAL